MDTLGSLGQHEFTFGFCGSIGVEISRVRKSCGGGSVLFEHSCSFVDGVKLPRYFIIYLVFARVSSVSFQNVSHFIVSPRNPRYHLVRISVCEWAACRFDTSEGGTVPSR